MILYRRYFLAVGQRALAHEIAEVVRQAPWFTPSMPRSGRPFSVKMTNCGRYGWVSDREGYRYTENHPSCGAPWPPIPHLALQAWRNLSDYPHPPEACLVNFYDQDAKMGLHQDRDEAEFAAPILSISLGCSCAFRYGGLRRGDKTNKLELHSGDVLVMGGPARLIFHGVDRVFAGSSDLLAECGRINLTLRRVTLP
ncbi:MAG TPA: alpha-ketoglutarate-dependent dioxygenase AlkB [Methylocella sp.]|nr:alpha-ketoglutarate-dependent dioxygenase AlkB [Methylocella sp.]